MLGRLGLEERQSRQVLREGVERPEACERQVGPACLEAVVLLAVIGDVLADALLAASSQAHDRRLAEEVFARLELERIEGVALDLEREVRTAS